ncbi:MAG: 23S rRNA (guanosine(2251)-2'-O)-methyltransferase RlmB [Chitinophagaceae bacterium]|nr:MAG: TrmH family RNA methyltransferase [Bacteroidetes bacterium OLB11]MCC6447284.1 23S rRNA (guanosine(2251)-2'-O)-methyltransferase RlmB [Chitinophagaceae bacterium]HMN32620.1 23S rRNA (guanosine(2251)-2'-O)-methyltransferase RlmB [Chitinophagaceae bacterium]
MQNFRKNTSKKSLIYGRNPLIEALHSDKPIDRILMYHSIVGESIGEIIKLAKEKHIPIIRVPQEKLNTLVKGNHQGIVAYTAVVDYVPLQDLISQLYDEGKEPKLLLLDGITDVRNTGAVIRSAVCCGIDAIIFSEKNSAPIHEDMVKTSAGALMKIIFCREKSMKSILDTLSSNGVKIFSSSLNAEKSLLAIDFKQPYCIVMGAEDRGVSRETLEACDETFFIPMVGNFDSLNVSVAAGIICFEAMKQKM